MVLVFSAEMALGALEVLDAIMDKFMGGKATFVWKLFLAFVAMEYFSGVQYLVKLHPMHSSGAKSAAWCRAVQQRGGVVINGNGGVSDDIFMGVISGVAQQRAQFCRLEVAI